MVLLAPFSQGTHLLSVGHLIIVSDQAYHRCVISKFNDDIGAVCSCTVMCVYREDRSGHNTTIVHNTTITNNTGYTTAQGICKVVFLKAPFLMCVLS